MVKQTLKKENFVVYDDIFDKDNYNRIWLHFQNETYSYVHFNKWISVWRATDGFPQKGPSYDEIKLPYNTYIDNIFKLFKNIADANKNIIPEWKNLTITPYLYPRETKLNWHNDGSYAGAIILYVHPYWASTWGGELMLAKTSVIEKVPNPSLDHSFEDKFLEQYGHGQYITCKPNRIVLTQKGIWHSINRVDKDAGDHVRASFVGFFHS